MTNDEIFARIGSDVVDIENSIFGARDITIWMTKDLFNRLFPKEYILLKDSAAIPTLFGCTVRVMISSCDGMRWIVGHEGKAEEDE